jgi:hypothetical protein
MIEFLTQYRGPVNLLLIFVLACFVLFRVVWLVRREMTNAAQQCSEEPSGQHPLLTAVDTAASIGTGISWTVLIYTGPSFAQLWKRQGSGSHWMTVLLYTWVWLTARPVGAIKGATAIVTSIVVRAAVYSIFFVLAIASVNDW